MVYALPSNTVGTVSVILSGEVLVDGGAKTGGTSTWQCAVIDYAGTCTVLSTCAATSAWASTDAATAWEAGLAITSCVATVTVKPYAGLIWSATFQHAAARK